MRSSRFLTGRVLGAAILASCAGSAADAAEAITWDWAIYGPPRAVTAGIETLAKAAEEKSGGNFKIKLHYGESIAPAKEVLDALKVGAIQGALTAFSYAPGKAPLHTVLDLPFLPIPNLEVQEKVMEDLYQFGPVQTELAKWNAVDLCGVNLPLYEFMGTGNPPRKLEDWKGMRVRALGGGGEAMRILGAIPTSVPAPEVYTALERGTFEAASFPFTYSFGAYRLHEVSKWYTYGFQFGFVHNAVTVSAPDYQRLPAEYKQILLDAKPAAYKAWRAAYAEADQKWLPIFDQLGLERITFTPEMSAEVQKIAGKPVWDKWVAEMEAKKLPGRETLDRVLAAAKKANGS